MEGGPGWRRAGLDSGPSHWLFSSPTKHTVNREIEGEPITELYNKPSNSINCLRWDCLLPERTGETQRPEDSWGRGKIISLSLLLFAQNWCLHLNSSFTDEDTKPYTFECLAQAGQDLLSMSVITPKLTLLPWHLLLLMELWWGFKGAVGCVAETKVLTRVNKNIGGLFSSHLSHPRGRMQPLLHHSLRELFTRPHFELVRTMAESPRVTQALVSHQIASNSASLHQQEGPTCKSSEVLIRLLRSHRQKAMSQKVT